MMDLFQRSKDFWCSTLVDALPIVKLPRFAIQTLRVALNANLALFIFIMLLLTRLVAFLLKTGLLVNSVSLCE